MLLVAHDRVGRMSRRAAAILTAVGLLLMLVVAAVRAPVPFVSLEPGPTLDVLSKNDGKPLVEVDGRASYDTEGSLRLVTVSETTPEHQVSLLEAMNAWWRPGVSLIPRKVAYPDKTSDQDERAVSAAQMVGSQDTAVAAALRELGVDLKSYPVVLGLTPGGPAEDKLEVRDQLVSIGGVETPDTDAVFNAVGKLDPGDEVEVELRRKGKQRSVTLKTVADDKDADRALIGIFPGTGYRFPFEVSVGLDDRIGGPSAGVVFALAIYDRLTPGALTGGESVAATGTIDAQGRTGSIGGVQQKILGAARDGATLFLLPSDNCDEATGTPVDDDIELVPVATLQDAIDAIQTHADDPDAELPRCPDES